LHHSSERRYHEKKEATIAEGKTARCPGEGGSGEKKKGKSVRKQGGKSQIGHTRDVKALHSLESRGGGKNKQKGKGPVNRLKREIPDPDMRGSSLTVSGKKCKGQLTGPRTKGSFLKKKKKSPAPRRCGQK